MTIATIVGIDVIVGAIEVKTLFDYSLSHRSIRSLYVSFELFILISQGFDFSISDLNSIFLLIDLLFVLLND